MSLNDNTSMNFFPYASGIVLLLQYLQVLYDYPDSNRGSQFDAPCGVYCTLSGAEVSPRPRKEYHDQLNMVLAGPEK